MVRFYHFHYLYWAVTGAQRLRKHPHAIESMDSVVTSNETMPQGSEQQMVACAYRLQDKIPPQNLASISTGVASDTGDYGTTSANALYPCVDGKSNDYDCKDIDLMSFISLADLNFGTQHEANDCWGWTHTLSGREFAIIGLRSGTSFVEITDPRNPIFLGKLPTHTFNSSWRDIKTYQNYAYIVSEASGHGMQIFDMSLLLTVSSPTTFTETGHYDRFGNSHNIFINEDTGYAYAVGTNTCSGGLHMIDLSDPLSPSQDGCFSDDGYTHDVQCVQYRGDDTIYTGQEICFACNENTVTIVNVEDKNNPVILSRTTYEKEEYTHQGWLTEDHNYFVFGDELDESRGRYSKTATLVMDVRDLNNAAFVGVHLSSVAAIDHNQYIIGDYIYQANYRAGLRVLRMNDISTADLEEVAYFDIYPSSNTAQFNGAWSNYPFYPSGTVIVSGIEQGLFVLNPILGSRVPTGSPRPTAQVTSSPTNAPTPDPCSVPHQVFKMNLLTDNYGYETTWTLVRDQGQEKIVENDGTLSSGVQYTAEECLVPGGYTFTISDSYGDGVCCGYGQGNYKITLDDDVVKEGGEFNDVESTSFDVTSGSTPVPTTSSPTNLPTTHAPSQAPTSGAPTAVPTSSPTNLPTTHAPSQAPTSGAPTAVPTSSPTNLPTTHAPSNVPTSGAPTAVPSTWTNITYDDFEDGWGNFEAGGGDVMFYTGGTRAKQGNNAALIRDNSNARSSFSHVFFHDVSGFNTLRVKFYYYPWSMESTEDFMLEYLTSSSTTTWNTVKRWASGTDFQNNNFYEGEALFDSSGIDFIRLRFRCDASGNRDRIYVDAIEFAGCVSNCI